MRDEKEVGERGTKIPWMRAKMPTGPPPTLGPEYAKQVVQRAKAKLREVVSDDDGRVGGVFWF